MNWILSLYWIGVILGLIGFALSLYKHNHSAAIWALCAATWALAGALKP